MRRALSVALLAFAPACGEQVLAPPPADSARPDAAPIADRARFELGAQGFMVSAKAYAETCHLQAAAPGNWFDYLFYDACSLDPVVVDAVAQGYARFRGSHPTAASFSPACVSFVAQSQLFADWVREASVRRVTRGTLVAYQALVQANNACRPDAKLATEPETALREYTVQHPEPHVHYILSTPIAGGSRNGYDQQRESGTPWRWRWSAQGPFIPSRGAFRDVYVSTPEGWKPVADAPERAER